MNDDELRSLVRDVVQRHLAGARAPGAPGAVLVWHHPSHGRFRLPAGAESEGPCLIEPAVACHHCGYCQSFGH